MLLQTGVGIIEMIKEKIIRKRLILEISKTFLASESDNFCLKKLEQAVRKDRFQLINTMMDYLHIKF